jgi:DNA-binding LytR/AlgR family response regulator
MFGGGNRGHFYSRSPPEIYASPSFRRQVSRAALPQGLRAQAGQLHLLSRASSGCIVNLSHVKQSRFLEDGSLIFILRDGKEVVLSRRQSVLFRRTHGL